MAPREVGTHGSRGQPITCSTTLIMIVMTTRMKRECKLCMLCSSNRSGALTFSDCGYDRKYEPDLSQGLPVRPATTWARIRSILGLVRCGDPWVRGVGAGSWLLWSVSKCAAAA